MSRDEKVFESFNRDSAELIDQVRGHLEGLLSNREEGFIFDLLSKARKEVRDVSKDAKDLKEENTHLQKLLKKEKKLRSEIEQKHFELDYDLQELKNQQSQQDDQLLEKQTKIQQLELELKESVENMTDMKEKVDTKQEDYMDLLNKYSKMLEKKKQEKERSENNETMSEENCNFTPNQLLKYNAFQNGLTSNPFRQSSKSKLKTLPPKNFFPTLNPFVEDCILEHEESVLSSTDCERIADTKAREDSFKDQSIRKLYSFFGKKESNKETNAPFKEEIMLNYDKDRITESRVEPNDDSTLKLYFYDRPTKNKFNLRSGIGGMEHSPALPPKTKRSLKHIPQDDGEPYFQGTDFPSSSILRQSLSQEIEEAETTMPLNNSSKEQEEPAKKLLFDSHSYPRRNAKVEHNGENNLPNAGMKGENNSDLIMSPNTLVYKLENFRQSIEGEVSSLKLVAEGILQLTECLQRAPKKDEDSEKEPIVDVQEKMTSEISEGPKSKRFLPLASKASKKKGMMARIGKWKESFKKIVESAREEVRETQVKGSVLIFNEGWSFGHSRGTKVTCATYVEFNNDADASLNRQVWIASCSSERAIITILDAVDPTLLVTTFECPSADSMISFSEKRRTTVWIGSNTGDLSLYSAQNKNCLKSINLGQPIVDMLSTNRRIYVALFNETVCIFEKTIDAQWNLTSYHQIRVSNQISCLCFYEDVLLVGSKKAIFTLNSSMKIKKLISFIDGTIFRIACHCHSVWVSLEGNSKIMLYDLDTSLLAQTFDVADYVYKVLKSPTESVKISALQCLNGFLWIGTEAGVILHVPMSKYGTLRSQDVALSINSNLWATKFFLQVPGPLNNHVLGIQRPEGDQMPRAEQLKLNMAGDDQPENFHMFAWVVQDPES